MERSSLCLALTTACAITGLAPAQAEETSVIVSGESVREIAPGLLKGYLSESDLLDCAAFVPPSPTARSAQQAFDDAWSYSTFPFRDTARWDMAIRDADLSFPAAVGAFSCALGFEIAEAETPALYLLLWRSLTDIGLSSYSAKNVYQRERPFMVNEAAICTPEDEEGLRSDGSYPSGHTAIGWGWALILAQLAPDRAEQILARGQAFGESRTICNVHWYSDVVAGRMVGAAAVARLQGNADFLAAMDGATEEIAALSARAQDINNECALEASTLEVRP